VQKAGKVLSKATPVLASNGSNQDAVDTWEELEYIA
jgi:hypothetical protein